MAKFSRFPVLFAFLTALAVPAGGSAAENQEDKVLQEQFDKATAVLVEETISGGTNMHCTVTAF